MPELTRVESFWWLGVGAAVRELGPRSLAWACQKGHRRVMSNSAATSGCAGGGGAQGTSSERARFPISHGPVLRRTFLSASGRPPPLAPIKKEETQPYQVPGGSAAKRMSKSSAGTAPCLPHSAARPCGRLVWRWRPRRCTQEAASRDWLVTGRSTRSGRGGSPALQC